MKQLNLCIPVLNRYDLLVKLLESAVKGTLAPSNVFVINNGRRNAEDTLRECRAAMGETHRLTLHTPDIPMGVAESWNWFVKHAPEERIITNDDVVFGTGSLEAMVKTEGDVVVSIRGNAFSCFLLRDSCIAKIGYFDEDISPGYAYFEDCDYEERMRRAGLELTHVDCDVLHLHSQTVHAMSPAELREHQRLFIRARGNFRRKWGFLPEGV